MFQLKGPVVSSSNFEFNAQPSKLWRRPTKVVMHHGNGAVVEGVRSMLPAHVYALPFIRTEVTDDPLSHVDANTIMILSSSVPLPETEIPDCLVLRLCDVRSTVSNESCIDVTKSEDHISGTLRAILNAPSTVVDLLKTLPEGNMLHRLTPAQAVSIIMICRGFLNKQIAYAASCRLTTVKAHLSEAYGRIGVWPRSRIISMFHDAFGARQRLEIYQLVNRHLDLRRGLESEASAVGGSGALGNPPS